MSLKHISNSSASLDCSSLNVTRISSQLTFLEI